MLCRNFGNIFVAAGTTALVMSGLSPGAIGDPRNPATVQAQRYAPLISISYELGSKFMSGYFTEEMGRCAITMMIIERSDPDNPTAFTAARVRLQLHPSQIAGLDSQEGRSINVTCGENAQTVLIDVGPTHKLIAAAQAALIAGEFTTAD